MSKIVIIEGNDNTGKDTMISKLTNKFPISTIIHCGKPVSKRYSSYEQDKLFNVYIDNIINGSFSSSHIVILNRSHIGEYVYGTLYRNREKDKVEKMISEIDQKLIESKNEVYYIQLMSVSNALLKKNEDGLSLSNANLTLISKERELFNEIYSKSKLNKKLIIVNKNDSFRPVDEIFNEIYKFIN